ncbi:zf-MIZ-domain-containing protein, partial [Saccharata proteae CBS 121410]
GQIKFRTSPFFEILEALAPPIELQILPNNRGSATSHLMLSPATVDRLKSDKNMRIMLYSAADPILGQYSETDIAFPQQLEVRVNSEQVTSNFKGIKNKAGTTRPADITDVVRKNPPKYNNTIQITYALTQKARKFHLVVNLVKKHPVEELVERIKRGNVLTKATVLKDMVARNDDPDIEATSTVMSLKDPVSYVRISLPCRSSICLHNQCFDASFFLQLQEQAPTWTCPVCNRVLLFESLVVDQYVQDILMNTSTSTDQVTIEPDGKWSQGNKTEEAQRGGTKRSYEDDDDSDDDLVEIIPDDRVKRLKQETSQTPYPLANTPPISSREQSTTGSAAATNAPGSGSNRQKRKSEVIDLTLSDDDDEPPRPAGR